MNDYRYFDGIKNYNLSMSADEWYQIFGRGEGQVVTPEKLYSTVAILNRCVRMRADAIAHVPFALTRKGGADVTTSDDWEDPTGLMLHPKRLMRQLESSLMFTNAAYLIQTRNVFNVSKELQYAIPTTITPVIDAQKGLTGFQRMGGSMAVDDLVYIWYQDGLTEIGPGDATIVGAAAAAAGVLSYLDQFVASYFKRGAINATILGVPQGTSKEAKQELEAWYQRVIQGVRNAFSAKVINSDTVKPTVIGGGIEGLANTGLTQGEKEDIATVTGVPMSMILSNAANFATAQQDERNLVQWAVLPDAELIAETLTEQVYAAKGFKLEFRPESMDSFQEDEVNRASAFGSYVSAGLKPSVAAQIVGVELPADMEYEDLDPEEPEPQPVPPALAPYAGQDNPPAEDAQPDPLIEQMIGKMSPEARKEAEIWQRKAIKALKAGLSANCEFVVQAIPQETAKAIIDGLEGCRTVEDIKALFDQHMNEGRELHPFLVLAQEIRLAREALTA